MVFPVVGGNESKGYEISNSLRFNDADSPHLTRTPSSSGNRRTWTMSCWFKKCEDGYDINKYLKSKESMKEFKRFN